MTPFKKRNLLIPISVALFAVILYSLNKFVPSLKSHIQHLEIIAISLMILMSLVVMLLWISLGVFGGLASFLIAMIFLYRPLTDMNPYYYSVLIAAFFLSSFIGYHIFRKINVSSQKYTVTMEKIVEDTNLIRNHLKNRRAEVAAVDVKVDSLLKLKNIADQLSLSLSSEKIVKIVTEQTFDIFAENRRVLLFTVNERTKELILSSTSKSDKRQTFTTKNGGIFERWTLKNMKSLLIKDIKQDYRFSIANEELSDDAVSVMIKPLIVEGNVLGLLRVDSPDDTSFAQHELRILDIIGEIAAVALENASLYHKTEELAIRDSLTGLYVHRYFMERLEEEVKRALHSGGTFAMIMMDIDNFKEFNDQHGHIAGDMVLKNISRVLKSKVSAGDIIGRYGGEEFAFMVLGSGKKETLRLAEEIREDISNATVTIRRIKYAVTVSVGVAIFPEDAKHREDIVWEADKCLYEAKAKGKNMVCSK